MAPLWGAGLCWTDSVMGETIKRSEAGQEPRVLGSTPWPLSKLLLVLSGGNGTILGSI